MRKATLLVLVIFIAFSQAAFGAVSNDMSEYVRKDVLEERDRTLITEIRLGNEKILREMDRRFNEMHREMDKRFNEVNTEMDRRFNEVNTEMNKRFSEVRTEMDKRFSEVDKHFAEMHTEMDKRFNEVDKHFGELEKQIATINERTEGTKTSTYWNFNVLTIILAVVTLLVAFTVFAPALSTFLKSMRTKKIPLDELEEILDKLLEKKFNGKITTVNQ